MNKTCKDAYDIFEQYNSIHKNPYNEKIAYLEKVLETFFENKDKDLISLGTLEILVVYFEKTLDRCKLSDSQKGRLVNSLVKVSFKCYPLQKEELSSLLNRIMNTIMD